MQRASKTIYTSAFVFGLLSASYKSFKALKGKDNDRDVRRVSFLYFKQSKRTLDAKTRKQQQWLGFWVIFGVLSMNMWTKNLRKLRTVIIVGMQFSEFGEDIQNYVFNHLASPLLRLCERAIERCRAPALDMIHRPVLEMTYWVQKQIVDYVASSDDERESEEIEKHLEEMSRAIGRERRKRETEELKSLVSKTNQQDTDRISSSNDENDAKMVNNTSIRRFKKRSQDRFFGRHSIGIFRQGGAFNDDGELR
jgi:hypothetical protein